MGPLCFLFYVMPYVEGETLRDWIDREKQLPVNDAVALASKVAGALQHAHEHGVIHRDIKPANILLQDGEPVVADFGIALAVGAAGSNRLTETGLSLGTPYYMSPEQATGDQSVGASTDTYALASVLYEMLVGDPPYPGSTAQAVLGKIIAGKPVSATDERPSIPANVDAAVRKALEKLPADRFSSAQDFVRALGDEHFRYGEETAAGTGVGRGLWNQLSIVTTGVALAATLALAWSLLRSPPPAPVIRVPSPFVEGQAPTNFLDFTADGTALVYIGPGEAGSETPQLWIRRWANLDAEPLGGTEGANAFALSPDRREVAFSGGGSLRVVPLDGGPGRTLAESGISGSGWAPDGAVYFSLLPGGLRRVPELGGEIEAVTELSEGEIFHGRLSLIPGGRVGVFQIWHNPSGADAEIWAVDLETGQRRFLTVGNLPKYAPTGHLLFGTEDGVLMAAPIDRSTAEFIGPAVPVAEDLTIAGGLGGVRYAVSATGMLIYSSGFRSASAGDAVLGELVWVDRSGMEEPVDESLPPLLLHTLALSPGDERLALSIVGEESQDLWVKELPEGPLTRLTTNPGIDRRPVWSADGMTISYIFSGTGAGNTPLAAGTFALSVRSDGSSTGNSEILLQRERPVYEVLFTPDERGLIFREGNADVGEGDLGYVDLETGIVNESMLVSEFNEKGIALSPDGLWLAYVSDVTGRDEVFVRPFPTVGGGRIQVSIEGGQEPAWVHNGRELFYRESASGPMLVATYSGDPDFEVEGSRRALRRQRLPPDGNRQLALLRRCER